ncbi:CobW family GTP-binding protein [Salipaludibacillus aurantiacus]|uniref:GTPase, G3E family n=1 Tax=Salipaludibacillus aurantiacus TaxID=1601833 RepID=A0A1H9QE84_9BACI|nr:GTP-binding protein [Salipaludibacillus aurantiacus]SER58123.1 GTPase, G3E family [Salipaludibacillus aurantiacus]
MSFQAPRIPVSILTGFLGSGKTTLLNAILADKQEERIAVIVNEFGDAGIDQQLVIGAQEEIFELNNGCLCCKIRTDLINTLYALIQAVEEQGHEPFDRVLIETSGLAEPAPVVQSFLVDPELSEIYHLDTVVTVIDSYHFLKQVQEHEEVRKQVAFADKFVLNKAGLVNSERRAKVKGMLASFNPAAPVHVTSDGEVSAAELLNQFTFDIEEKLRIEPGFMDHSHHHHHDHEISSIVLQSQKAVDIKEFEKWFGDLVDNKGEQMYRYKGILNVDGFNKRIIFQGIHMLFAGKAGAPWTADEERKSQFVIIGKGLDQDLFQREFEACLTE